MRKNSISVDFNNMFQSGVGQHGISEEQFNGALGVVPAMHSGVEAKKGENVWRSLPFDFPEVVEDIKATGKMIREKFEAFVVLGIGGSALGSKALFTGLKHLRYNELENRGGPKFYVLDNVDPDGLSALFDVIDPAKTCFHAISKSGNTVETATQFMLALAEVKKAVGDSFRDHFVVTTDKEKGNMKLIADENSFKTFVVPDGVGGRFSVLCPVGLLSAAVLDINIDDLLAGAGDMDKQCSNPTLEQNPAYMYALTHYVAFKNGVNISVMMPYADGLLNSAEWYAQLWAESLGKRYKNDGSDTFCGQTPVRALGVTDQHSQVQLYTEGPFDKIITIIEVDKFNKTYVIPEAPIDVKDAKYLAGQTFNKLISSEMKATEYAIKTAGKMNMRITISEMNAYNLGALFSLLEMATAASGELFDIDAFDQPGVEMGKIATFALMGREGYEEKAAELNAVSDIDKTKVYCY